jgi:hypothetical protein
MKQKAIYVRYNATEMLFSLVSTFIYDFNRQCFNPTATSKVVTFLETAVLDSNVLLRNSNALAVPIGSIRPLNHPQAPVF